MAASSSDNDDEITGINVTPLVDVMLVLLIIFMVTATYIVNQSISVNLPKAETSDTNDKSKNLAFVLDAKSQLFLNGQPVSFDDLPKLIAAEKGKDAPGPLNALISADTATPHGSVVKLIDMVRKNGITDFAINVEAAATTATP
jgi:biopolymer transport protein ExbD